MLHKNQHNNHRPSKSSLTIVVKIGTSSICNEVTHFPLLSNLSALVENVLHLRSQGHRVVLVTSAAIGTGLRRLNMAEKPSKLAAKQVKLDPVQRNSFSPSTFPNLGCCCGWTRKIDGVI